MDDHLSINAQKVQSALKNLGLDCQVVELSDSTRTAVDAANAIGCTVGQIVKSLIFRTRETGQPILVLASGANRVNEKLLADQLGEPVEKGDADFVRSQTGFAIGGIPPVGHTKQPLTFIDQDLLQYSEVWAAAGTPHAVFPLDPKQLSRITNGKIIAIHEKQYPQRST